MVKELRIKNKNNLLGEKNYDISTFYYNLHDEYFRSSWHIILKKPASGGARRKKKDDIHFEYRARVSRQMTAVKQRNYS